MFKLPLTNFGVLEGYGGLHTASEVQYDLRLVTSHLEYPDIHVHIVYNSNFHGLGGNNSLKTASDPEVTCDLGCELLDLNDLCFHVSLSSKCHYFKKVLRSRPNIIHIPSKPKKNCVRG